MVQMVGPFPHYLFSLCPKVRVLQSKISDKKINSPSSQNYFGPRESLWQSWQWWDDDGDKTQRGRCLGTITTSASKTSIRRFVITEKAPTRAFSWLMKAATTAFTFKTLLRHYAKRALNPWSLNVKLGLWHKSPKGWAGWLAKCLIAARPLW